MRTHRATSKAITLALHRKCCDEAGQCQQYGRRNDEHHARFPGLDGRQRRGRPSSKGDRRLGPASGYRSRFLPVRVAAAAAPVIAMSAECVPWARA